MKKSFILFFLTVVLVSCTRQARMSPAIELRPNYVEIAVGEVSTVMFVTKSDGKKTVSVSDTTVARAELTPQGMILVKGLKEGTTTLKAETGLTKRFNWGDATCPITVKKASYSDSVVYE